MESAVPAIAGQLDPVHSAKQCKRRTTVMNFQEGRIKNKKNNKKKKENEEP